MEKLHAFLSASGAERWMNCTPSARLTENMEESESEYATEGTEAHALAEYKLRVALGETPECPRKNLTYLDSEMEMLTDDYVAYIMEIIGQAENPVVLVEQRLDFSRWVTEGFGTSDCIIIDGNTLHVVDFKYGNSHGLHLPTLLCLTIAIFPKFSARLTAWFRGQRVSRNMRIQRQSTVKHGRGINSFTASRGERLLTKSKPQRFCEKMGTPKFTKANFSDLPPSIN